MRAIQTVILLVAGLYLSAIEASPHGTPNPWPATRFRHLPDPIISRLRYAWTAIPGFNIGWPPRWEVSEDVPTNKPTDLPTNEATDLPTNGPTDLPTNGATDLPTNTGTDVQASVTTVPAYGDDSESLPSGPIETGVRRRDLGPKIVQGKLLAGFDYMTKSWCEKKGDTAEIRNVKAFANEACAAFVQNLPGGQVVDTKWFRFAVTNIVDATTGEHTVINYRWRRLSATGTPLSAELCRQVYDQLSSSLCVNEKEKSTKGATMRVGDDDGLEIGFDPDDMSDYDKDDKRYTNVGKVIQAT